MIFSVAFQIPRINSYRAKIFRAESSRIR